MKKLNSILALALALVVASVAGAAITGSGHDFSGAGYGTTEICRPCHTPHNAYFAASGGAPYPAPLWNHTATTATFTLYTSPTGTLNAAMGQPAGATKACLSCHDGTVAVDSFGGATGTHPILPANSAYLGTDLSNDHPVSFTYDAALATADGGLYNPVTQLSGIGPTGSTIATTMLFGGKMECASCHDVHNAANLAGMLLKSNTASALCLTCHNK